MRTILILALLAACLPPPIERSGGPVFYPATLPPLERDQRIREIKGIDGLRVVGAPDGAAAWSLRLKNTTDDSMSVLWDESSFVASTDDSMGRLIRGETHKIDLAKTQPPSPLAPHAAITETIFVEKFVDVEETEQVARKSSDEGILSRDDRNRFLNYREKLATSIVGGHLYLVVLTDDGKHTWSGVVESRNRPGKRSPDSANDEEEPPPK